MSSAVVSTSAPPGRPFVFDDESDAVAHLLTGVHKKPSGIQESASAKVFQSTINQQSTIANRKSAIENSIVPASQLAIRPVPEMAPSGIPALDALTSGLPRGCITEICGAASSGRTTLLLAALAAASRRGEFCAVVDASDTLDPHSVGAAAVDLDRLLWVRCGEDSLQKNFSPQRRRDTENNRKDTRASERRLEQVLRATDLLLESGGFGLIVLDLADLPLQAARRIPLTTWFRFRRAIEHTPTILLAIEQQPIAGSCSSLQLQLGVLSTGYSVSNSSETFVQNGAGVLRTATEDRSPSHAHLFTGLQINADLIRSRLERKPARSVTFAAKTAWAG